MLRFEVIFAPIDPDPRVDAFASFLEEVIFTDRAFESAGSEPGGGRVICDVADGVIDAEDADDISLFVYVLQRCASALSVESLLPVCSRGSSSIGAIAGAGA